MHRTCSFQFELWSLSLSTQKRAEMLSGQAMCQENQLQGSQLLSRFQNGKKVLLSCHRKIRSQAACRYMKWRRTAPALSPDILQGTLKLLVLLMVMLQCLKAVRFVLSSLAHRQPFCRAVPTKRHCHWPLENAGVMYRTDRAPKPVPLLKYLLL